MSKSQALLRVERAVDELRRGRGVTVTHRGHRDLIYGLEVADFDQIASLAELSGLELELVITGERARAVGHEAPHGVETLRYRCRPTDDRAWLAKLALSVPAADLNGATCDLLPGEPYLDSGVKLVKLARLVPALAVLKVERGLPGGAWFSLSADDIEAYDVESARALAIAARARIPLRDQVPSEFVVFRDQAGRDDYVAVLIGGRWSRPPLVRLHSACFTGDLFGSMRCDCGSQLQQAIDAIAAGGGGVLLYLPQEGRGIGLANKLRAYAVQDTGFDTMEADAHLGFKADERSYHAAARMLSALDIGAIRLLTNSPQKMDALREAGIDIVERVALTTSPNPHNRRYLRAKASKAGHWLDNPA